MIKWFAAIAGYMFFRFPGAILGFVLGSFLDNMGGSGRSQQTIFRDVVRGNVSPADFELNLLSLCSIVIKADGQVSQRELDYVRQYFLSTYGKEKANAIFRTFNDVIKKREVSAQRICNYLNQRTRYEVRLQLLHFLFGIAQADGQVSKAEVNKLSELAGYLRIGRNDFESIKAMFIKSADNVHKLKHKISILGLVKGYQEAAIFEKNLRDRKRIQRYESFTKTIEVMIDFLVSL